MSSRSRNSGSNDILTSIEKRLRTIQKVLSKLEKRVNAIEKVVGQSVAIQQENPLVYSRVLMGTLNAIRRFEEEHDRGVVAKDLAPMRKVELPTIYDHLSKLEEANLVLWQRGTELGLKPHNAKFYSVSKRDHRLTDLPVLMALPDTAIPIAQAIVRGSQKGVSRSKLLEMAMSLKEQGEKGWKRCTLDELERRVHDAITSLLRRVLIIRKRTPNEEYYYVREEKSSIRPERP